MKSTNSRENVFYCVQMQEIVIIIKIGAFLDALYNCNFQKQLNLAFYRCFYLVRLYEREIEIILDMKEKVCREKFYKYSQMSLRQYKGIFQNQFIVTVVTINSNKEGIEKSETCITKETKTYNCNIELF